MTRRARPPDFPFPTSSDLGTFGGGNGNSNARAITNNLQADIAGYAETGAVVNGRRVTHAFVYATGGEFNQDQNVMTGPATFTDLGTLGGLISVGFGIYQQTEQSQPQVVGGAGTGGRDPNNPVAHAFLHIGLGQIDPATDDLGVLPTYTDSTPTASFQAARSSAARSPSSARLPRRLFSPAHAPTSLGLCRAASAVTLTLRTPASQSVTPTSTAAHSSPSHSPWAPPIGAGFPAGGLYYRYRRWRQQRRRHRRTDFQTDSQGNPTKIHAFLYTGGASSYDINSLLSPASAGNTVEEASGINSYGQSPRTA